MNVLNLVAKLTLDKTNFDSDLEQSEQKASQFGEAIGTGLNVAAKIGAAAIATVSTAIVALGAAIVKGTKETAEYGDKVDKMSQKIGISTDAYQEWEYVMNLAGGSVDNLQAGMRTLSNVLVDAAEGSQSAYEALEAVGLEIDDLEGMTLEEKLNAVIGALGDMEEGEERTVAATKLLGRSATDLAPLLNMTSEEIEKAKQEAHDLGMVMSKEDVKAAATLQDSLTRFQGTLRGVKNQIFSDFMPALTSMIDGFTQLVAGNEEGAEQIMAGFDMIIDSLADKVPVFIDLAGRIIMALINGFAEHISDIVQAAIDIMTALVKQIVDMLPTLAKAAVEIITTMVDKFVEMLPDLMDAAILLIVTIAEALVNALPRLIPAIVTIMLTIVDKLTQPDTLVMLINVALQLILALADGIVRALPQLIKMIPQIVVNIVKALVEAFPQILKAGMELITNLGKGIAEAIPGLTNAISKVWTAIKTKVSEWWDKAKNWGKDLINNFIGGITETIGKVKDAVKGVGNKIKDFLGFSEPEEGPLSNFHTFAPDMMKLFAQGIKDNEDLITAQIEKSFDLEGKITNVSQSVLDPSTSPAGGTSGDAAINITVQSVLDGRVLAESLYKYQRISQRVYGR